METKHYDVFVIGSGIAGQTVAKTCAKNNLKVAVAEKIKFGGTCALRGCDPKKVMMQFSEITKKTKQLQGLGFTDLPKIDWQQVLDFKDKFIKKVPTATKENLEELGIDLYSESPRFTDENTIKIGDEKITATHFVIASGLTPRELAISGKEYLKTSKDIFSLPSIPKSMIFIGSGYVGMEFASMFATLGSKVTVIETGEKILSQFDEYLTDKIQESLEKEGVKFIFNAETTSIERNNNQLLLKYKVDGKEHELTSEEIFNTSGRVPSVQDLDLEIANIKNDNKKGVLVTDYLQSETNKKVFACGDVSSKSLPLTPLSGLQGHIVAQNILKGNQKKFENPLVPSIVFSHPNISRVGLSEKEAKKNCKNLKVYKGDASNWYNAKKENTDAYAFKIFVDDDSQLILGAELLGTEANESINIITMAMEKNITIKELKKMIFTYPSYAIDLRKMFKKED
ncbi:NAD(P)/FAD-dependent oxidoreductase [Polaribacter sp.]|nr:NAD(P)/FAD-dependent oxidoreductase [Polaribacter sp.]